MQNTNDEFYCQMFDCCVTVVKVLLNKYQNRVLTKEELIEHSNKKIQFILNEIENPKINADLKIEAYKMLKDYNDILYTEILHG